MKTEIVTNYHVRPFRYRDEVPSRVLKGQFSHLPGENDRFLKYRGYWYHTSDFMRITGDKTFQGWDGYLSETYFSGVLIKIVDDDYYIVGTYFS